MNKYYDDILNNRDDRFNEIVEAVVGNDIYRDDIIQDFYYRFIKYDYLFKRLKDEQIYYYISMVLKQIVKTNHTDFKCNELVDIDIGYDNNIEQEIDNEIILKGLSILDFYERELIKLYYFEYMTYREISSLTHIPITSLNLSIRKAIEKIRNYYSL